MSHDSSPSHRTAQDTVELDWRDRDQNPTRCVVDAIAALTGVPPTRQRPLYESIDPDALDSILEPPSEPADRREPLAVSFYHQGCEVVITGGGHLSVTPRAGDR